MSDDLLRQYVNAADVAEPDEPSFVRGERPPRLEIREADGNSRSFPYSSLEYVDFNPSVGLSLVFSTCKVELAGRNLGRLYDALNAQAVRCVQIALDRAGSTDDGQTVVDSCKVESAD